MTTTTSAYTAVRSISETDLADPQRAAEPVVASLLSLSLKMALAQLAPLAMSLYLARLVAHSGDLEFSGYSLILAVNLTVFISASAFLQSLYYVGGCAIGRNNQGEYAAAMIAGLGISVAVGLLCTLISALVGPFLNLLAIEPEIASRATWFGFTAAAGIPPTLLMVVYRIHASLRHHAGSVSILLSLSAVITAVVATVSVSTPGPVGTSVLLSLALVNWLTLVAGLATFGMFRRLRLDRAAIAASRPYLTEALQVIWAVGWPIGLIVFMDSLASLTSSLIAARYWPDAMPVHAVAFLWLSLGLVVPLGIAQAALQRVSVTHAAGDLATRNRVATTALIASATYGALATIGFIVFPHQLGAFLLQRTMLSPETESLLGEILPLVGLALVAQSVIITAALLLRGIGYARAALFQAFIGYCVVAIGGEALFGIVVCGRLAGVWYGLILGFAGTAIALAWRCIWIFRTTTDDQPNRRLSRR